MYAEERQEKIFAILKEKRKLSVGEMSERFNVSGATIRTDLRILEDAGMLTRTHGGAILRTRASFEISPISVRRSTSPPKNRLGNWRPVWLKTAISSCWIPAPPPCK